MQLRPRRLIALIALTLPPVLHAQSASPTPAVSSSELLLSESPAVFFEDYPTWANASPDGRWAIYGGWTGIRVLDVNARRMAPERVWSGLSDTYRATWGPKGELLLYGRLGGQSGWYANGEGGPRLLPLPRGSRPVWSPDGAQVAYAQASTPDSVYVGAPGEARAIFVAGRAIAGMAWLPDGSALLVLAVQPRGTSTLARIEMPSGMSRVVAGGLDAPPVFLSQVAVAPDGRHAYVALASAGDPAPEARHAPHAERRLGIYAIDLATGGRELIVAPPAEGGDAMAPSVGGGSLFWTVSRTEASVVALPAAGGPAQLVMRGAFVPSWRPDGRQIGFAYGDWRWVDWAIGWDGGAVDVDGRGRPLGPLRPVVTGYHEDFQPVWSPRGRWVAYHSHRPKTPAPYYDAPDASDDIWLKPVGAPSRDSAEIRVTDFGWEAGPPDWSPDGTRMVFTSYDRAGAPGVDQPFLVTIDTLTGRATSHVRLPLPPEVHNAKSVAWSPDGERIALEEDLGTGRHALWLVRSDGTHARKLTEFPMATYAGLSWTRDGTGIIYPALTEGRMQLFRIGVTGGKARQLSHDDANLFEPAVSPDGSVIAATRLLHTKQVWRMRLTAP